MLDHRLEMIKKKLANIENIILVCSGKGGVGKSLVSVSIALALKDKGKRVGLLDLDIHGPVIPLILDLKPEKLLGDKEGLKPVEAKGLKVMSLALYVGEKPIPLRSIFKESLILDLFSEVNWGSLDYLIVDMPPGTGDEILIPLRLLKDKGKALIVTIPSFLSLSVVKRLIKLLKREKVPILGLVENMSYIKCDSKIIRLFGEYNLKELNIPLLASLPFDPEIEEILVKGDDLGKAKLFWNAILKLTSKIN